MQLKTLLQIFLVSVTLHCFINLASARYLDVGEYPPPNAPSEKSLNEQQEDIYQCWKDAGVGHGKDSDDPYVFAPTARSTKVEDCQKLTTWFEDCKCFMSVLRKDGTQVVVTFHPQTGMGSKHISHYKE